MNCVFTLQHNEYYYLPKWIKYYSSQFDTKDMYILAHNSDGRMRDMLKDAEGKGINVIYLDTDEIFNHDWLTGKVHHYQRELLNKYDYVIYTDCDEFIVPIYGTLKEFLANAKEKAYRCAGFDAIGDRISRNDRFDKTLITSIPLVYEHGYHTAKPEIRVNNDLALFHIHRFDYDEAYSRNLRLEAEKWDSTAVNKALGTQNRITDRQKFDEWFYKGVDDAFESNLFNNLLEEIL